MNLSRIESRIPNMDFDDLFRTLCRIERLKRTQDTIELFFSRFPFLPDWVRKLVQKIVLFVL